MVHWEQRTTSDESDDCSGPYLLPPLAEESRFLTSSSPVSPSPHTSHSSSSYGGGHPHASFASSSSSSSSFASPRPSSLTERTRSVERQGGLPYHEIERSGPAAQPLEFPAPTVRRGARIDVNGCDHRTGTVRRVRNVLVRLPDHTQRCGGGVGGKGVGCGPGGLGGGGRGYMRYGAAAGPGGADRCGRIPTGGGARADAALAPAVPDRGYCIRRKIRDTVYGSIRLCVVMRRRRSFLHETSKSSDGVGAKHQHQHQPRHSVGKKKVGPASSCVKGSGAAAGAAGVRFADKKGGGGGGGLERIGEDDDWSDESLEPSQGDTQNQHGEDDDDVVWETTDELVVVKVVSWAKVQYKRGKHLEDPIKEVAAMQLIGGYHPNVVGSLEVLQDSGHLYTITPYCDGGDLYSWTMHEFQTNGSGRLDEVQARHWFRQILQGLHHLQKKGVCHRDISLENILVHQNRCAIIDFGMALRVPYTDPCNPGCVTDVSAGTTRRLMRAQGQGGRWTYMAPEVVSRDPAFDGFAIDLWAAAVSLYIMLVGLAPFRWAHESDRRFLKFSTGGLKETLRYWNIPVSDEACDLMQNMLWRDPRQRLTLAEVMQHPWLTQEADEVVGTAGEGREEVSGNGTGGAPRKLAPPPPKPSKAQVSDCCEEQPVEKRFEKLLVLSPAAAESLAVGAKCAGGRKIPDMLRLSTVKNENGLGHI